ncbi:MAG TPA: gamma-glutamyltransferase, partial [Gemmataceae bacterium]|nr:gamma-glutamyltransferase [Gemmataceae bacterium]
LAAFTTMFKKNDSMFGCKPVGVPGTVAGLAMAHKRFGKLPWKEVVLPAVRQAEDGFVMDKALARSLNRIVRDCNDFPELRRVYGKPGPSDDRASWQAGDRLVQSDLARTLHLIAERGAAAFYQGPIAEQIVAEMQRGHGLITARDLVGYSAHARKPIHGTYRGYDIYGPAPPSSGGIALVEMLNILENFDLHKQGRFAPETLHLMIETMRRAFCDRARYLGDTDFVQVPAFLTSKHYARKLAHGIDPNHATRSADLAQDIPLAREEQNTTHFSIIDQDGMAVSNTYTLEQSYGSRVVVHGAGFLLNDEMNDFNWYPGVTDRKGRIGTPPNQIAPGKRMLSSMTPTIVAKDGKAALVTGSPGSRTIINTVLCVVVNVIDFHMNIQAAVDAPRLDQEWFPDRATIEGKNAYPEVIKRLKAMGHKIRGARQGDAHSIWIDPRTGLYHPAADHRLDGKADGF